MREEQHRQDQDHAEIHHPPVELGPEEITAPEVQDETAQAEEARTANEARGKEISEISPPRNQWVLFITLSLIAILLLAFLSFFF